MPLRRLAAPVLAALALLGLAALGGLVAGPAADPRTVGGTPNTVRILRGHGSDAPPAPARTRADSLASDAGDVQAIALARRFVAAYGGPDALRAWINSGERRGRQSIYAPAQISVHYVDRRQDGQARIDASNGGIEVSFSDGPLGSWQSYLGLVSDLPPAQKEELDRGRAHDESLLLDVIEGRAVASAVRVDGADALRVEGPLGGPTTFVSGPDGPDKGPAEIRFRDRSELRSDDVDQVIRVGDWRQLAPDTRGLVGPEGARVPFVLEHTIDGTPVEADSIDTIDLLAAFEDSVFARPGSVDALVGPTHRTVLPLVAAEGHHFARVILDDGPPRLFLVDTGAGVTVISTALADTLRLGLGGAAGLVGLSQGVAARSTTVGSLRLGDFVQKDVPCFVLDLAGLEGRLGAPVDGILGFSALHRYAVTFDFVRGTLELAENGPPVAAGPGGARLPMSMLGGVASADGRVDGGAPVPFLLDTGSPQTFVPAEIGRTLPGANAAHPTYTAFVGADGKPLRATQVTARQLAFGDARVARPKLLFMDSDHGADPIGLTLGSGDRGVLGADILTRFKVTLDYPRGELVLARP